MASRRIVVIALIVALWGSQGQGGEPSIDRGEYLFKTAGCVGCHTDEDNGGPYLAGGRALTTPFGVFYAPNITPDPETGIGTWSEQDLVRALRDGISPQGAHYYPVFPYTSYTAISDEDMRAIWDYLSSVQPVYRPNRPHELRWYLQSRLVNWAWKLVFFERGELTADPSQSEQWNRGRYLVAALGHCGECHTPRNVLGAMVGDKYLAGTSEGPEGKTVPNITPHQKTGIGKWSAEDLRYFLETGADPDGDYVGGLMAEVIDNGLQHLKQIDLDAMTTYLRSVKPIEHAVSRRSDRRDRGDY